jgi:hypothetical protein
VQPAPRSRRLARRRSNASHSAELTAQWALLAHGHGRLLGALTSVRRRQDRRPCNGLLARGPAPGGRTAAQCRQHMRATADAAAISRRQVLSAAGAGGQPGLPVACVLARRASRRAAAPRAAPRTCRTQGAAMQASAPLPPRTPSQQRGMRGGGCRGASVWSDGPLARPLCRSAWTRACLCTMLPAPTLAAGRLWLCPRSSCSKFTSITTATGTNGERSGCIRSPCTGRQRQVRWRCTPARLALQRAAAGAHQAPRQRLCPPPRSPPLALPSGHVKAAEAPWPVPHHLRAALQVKRHASWTTPSFRGAACPCSYTHPCCTLMASSSYAPWQACTPCCKKAGLIEGGCRAPASQLACAGCRPPPRRLPHQPACVARAL